jgi:hypothetical protein
MAFLTLPYLDVGLGRMTSLDHHCATLLSLQTLLFTGDLSSCLRDPPRVSPSVSSGSPILPVIRRVARALGRPDSAPWLLCLRLAAVEGPLRGGLGGGRGRVHGLRGVGGVVGLLHATHGIAIRLPKTKKDNQISIRCVDAWLYGKAADSVVKA